MSDDLKRRADRLECRADEIDALPFHQKFQAAAMLFDDTKSLIADLLFHINEIEESKGAENG